MATVVGGVGYGLYFVTKVRALFEVKHRGTRANR